MGGCSPSRQELGPCQRCCSQDTTRFYGVETDTNGEVHHVTCGQEEAQQMQIPKFNEITSPMVLESSARQTQTGQMSPGASGHGWESLRGRSSQASERQVNLPPARFQSKESRLFIEDDCASVASLALSELQKMSKPQDDSTSDCSTSLCSEVIELEYEEADSDNSRRRRPVRRKFVGKKDVDTAAPGVVIDNTGDVHKAYTFSEKALATGRFGPVTKAVVQATGAPRAVRSVSKADATALLKKSIKVMKAADHPNIISLYELFEDDKNVYMVMELCEGGDVKTFFSKTERKSEVQCAMLMQQILRAIFYLHMHSICHRNLIAGNILMLNSAVVEKNMAKVTGFSSAVYLKKNQVLKRRVGSASHMAPEMLAGKYDKACDMWAAGVILYELVTFKLPFEGTTEEEIEAAIPKTEVTMGSAASQPCAELLSKLLDRNAKSRYKVQQAIEHSWIKKANPKFGQAPLTPDLLLRLQGFRSLNIFKRAALQVVATMLSQADTSLPRRLFHSLDVNGDGELSVLELKERILAEAHKQNLSVEDERSIKLMFSDADAAGGGLKAFGYTEFVAATFDRDSCLADGVCKAAFSFFDKNGDGLISMADMAQGKLLGHLSLEELAQVLEELDVNNDQFVDFDEFVLMMKSGN